MANTYVTISSNSIVSGGPGATVVADEYLQIAPNVEIIGGGSDDGITLRSGTAAGGAINVQGYVAGYYGVSLRYDTGNETISVGPAGSIVGQDDGVYLQSQPTGYVQRLDNEGYIYGATNGVSLLDDDAHIENAGTIDAGYVAVVVVGNSDIVVNDEGGRITGDGNAISASGTGFSLVNAGSISTSSSQAAAVAIFGSGGSVVSSGDIQAQNDAVSFNAGQDSLHNSGTISAGGSANGSEAVVFGGGGDYVDNSGEISSSGSGVVVIFGSGNQTDWVVNEAGGVMEVNSSPYNSVIFDLDDMLHAINRGEMVGNVEAYGDDSSFTNTGDYTGELNLAGGGELVRNAGKITFDGTTDILAAALQTDSTIVNGMNINIGGADGYDDRLVNATGGVIDATGAIAIEHGSAGTFRLVNRGDIYGDIDLYGSASVVNAGTIGGDVNFDAAAGLFINRDLLDGNVTFSGTGNVYRGYLGSVTGTIYGAGADGRYFGGDADDTFDMTASGAKLVSGGAGDDTFIFTASGLNVATVVRGGAGDDTLTFSTAGTIGANALKNVTSIETINLGNGANSLTVPDSLASSAGGGALTINGNVKADTINVSGVTNAADVVTIYGGLGQDQITAGGGEDIFQYKAASESGGASCDTIIGANLNVDRFDVSAFAGAIAGINTAVTTGSLSTSTFASDLQNDLPAAKLSAHDAVLFTASAGTLAGQTYLVVDANGVAGYQSSADLVIHLTGQTGTLTKADFI